MITPKKQAVVILTPGFPQDEADTTCLPERQVFVRKLAQQHPHLQVIVVSFQYPYRKRFYKWYGCDVFALGGRNRGMLRRGITWLQAWMRLRRVWKSFHVHGMMSFWLGECALVGSWFSKFHGITHLTWLLGQDARKGNKYVQILNPLPGSLIALSDFHAEEFDKNYSIRPAHVITPGIDVTLFPAPGKERNIDILGAGSLIPLKQYDVFLRVVKAVSRSWPRLKVVLCGGGPELQVLRDYTTREGLAHLVEFTGQITHTEVLKKMQQARVFLHPSSYEGYGIVQAEALYAGAQVISFSRPSQDPVHKWNVVSTEQHMVEKVLETLNKKEDDESVLVMDVSQTVSRFMALLNTGKQEQFKPPVFQMLFMNKE